MKADIDITKSQNQAFTPGPVGWLYQPRLLVTALATAFLFTEAFGAWIGLTGAAILDAVFIAVTLNIALFASAQHRTTAVVMSALFTTRLITLALPMTSVSVPARTAVAGIFGCIVAVLAMNALGSPNKSEELPPVRQFLSKNWTWAVTIFSGFPIGWAAFHILDPSPLSMHHMLSNSMLPILAAVGALAVGAASEELIYRSLIAEMMHRTARSQTPVVSAVLFASTYFGYHSAAMIGLALVSGLVFAVSRELTGSVKPAICAHAIASILAFVVLP